MTGPEGNSEFCFPRISMFPETKSRETLRLWDLFYKRTKANFELWLQVWLHPRKVIFIAQNDSFVKIFVLYFSFYHLPLLSTYFHVFISFQVIFSPAILLLIWKVLLFFLYLKMISARSKRRIFSQVSILKCVSKVLLIRIIKTLRYHSYLKISWQFST